MEEQVGEGPKSCINRKQLDIVMSTPLKHLSQKTVEEQKFTAPKKPKGKQQNQCK